MYCQTKLRINHLAAVKSVAILEIIEEANWLTLPDDIHKPNGGFDAVICLGNSFAHLFDMKGDMSDIKLAIRNFHEMIKPNGYLLIDHRNYDYTLKHGKTPAQSIYYNNFCFTQLLWAVGSLVVRASDSRPEGLGSMLDVTKYPPSAQGVRAR
ncbi:glycine N-methyltransferase [Trichonephila clavipes]|nr:glycine N-methyltransferase [Trichonephila clavipes]